MHWYGLPEELAESVDIADPAVVRACNPAAWLNVDDILAELRRPDTRELDWRRLHLNAWTAARESWLPAGTWAGLRSAESQIPDGTPIHVAIDAALKYDSTAVSWAARLEDGRIALGCRVWSARGDAPHHVYCPGGRIDNSLVETFITEELDRKYDVREVVGDERYLSDVLSRLSEAGFVVAEFPQNSALMANSYQGFYEAATSGTVVWHDPDGVFARHVDAAAAAQTERGWRVYKLKSCQPIDALVAAAMARERCASGVAQEPWDPVFV
jgi:phage terminase large subunit-like protein